MTRRCAEERGATAVLIAFIMVGLLAFGGLVIDGGDAFAQRRQMQNASDASATAGANALYLYKRGTGSGADVFLKAREAAVANGAKQSSFTCDLVLYNGLGVETGTTPCQGATNASLNAAFKVRVHTDSDHSTQLIRVVGIQSFNARGAAAASLRAGSVANSPFMLCAAPGTAHTPPLLLPDVTDPTGWKINPAAIDVVYDIWGNPIKDSDCGIGNDFRGLVDNATGYAIPGIWPADSGNKAGHRVAASLIGGCTVEKDVQIKDIPPDCEFAIPLCDAAAGAKSLHCVKVGRFRTVLDPSNTMIMARFLGGGLVTSGEGSGIPSPQDVTIIKLSE